MMSSLSSRFCAFVLSIMLGLAACNGPTAALPPSPTSPALQPTALSTAAAASTPAAPTLAAPTAAPKVERQPIADGPILLREGIDLRKVVAVESGSIRLARHPTSGETYLLSPVSGLALVDLVGGGAPTPVASLAEMVGKASPSGMAFGPDGALYVVANQRVAFKTQAVIRRGSFDAAGELSWATVATTEPYAMSGTPFDHLFNGIVISPDGQWLYVNSGSRTDHGEVETNNGAFNDLREEPITSAIFRLPADSNELLLKNDAAALKPYLFADGTRNAYDLAFAPNDELFGVDNGPDADYADELNWLREGQHYGFPWRFGNQDNAQQFPDYDSSKDLLLSTDFTAVKSGTYRNDPTFPPAPGPFSDPIINLGPDAAQYRAADGQQRDAAAEGQPFAGVTPHRSPLGLVFASDAAMPEALRSSEAMLSAFVLSWGSAGGTLTDTGEDLLHLQLVEQGDNYSSVTNQLAKGFHNPIDALLIENRLYVLEDGQNSAIWELTFR